jgi:riboflavin synthase
MVSISESGTNKSFWIESSISSQLKPDQSVSHNGVCLTIEEVKESSHKVTAIKETLEKTSLDKWRPGMLVNLERCMVLNGRFDGHIVQGHVDSIATCIRRTDLSGSWEYEFRFPEQFASLVIEKGSICIDGTSLTAYNVTNESLMLSVIPFTFEHTTINSVVAGSIVNIEYDILGKYLLRFKQVPHLTVSSQSAPH